MIPELICMEETKTILAIGFFFMKMNVREIFQNK